MLSSISSAVFVPNRPSMPSNAFCNSKLTSSSCIGFLSAISITAVIAAPDFMIELYCLGVVRPMFSPGLLSRLRDVSMCFFNLFIPSPVRAVSYTHLTLPTILLV